MNIKERFYQIASVNMKNKCSPAELEDFAEALVAELAKENKPVAWCVGYDSPRHRRIHSNPTMYKPEAEALVLATVPNFGLSVCELYSLPPTAEQIEQRVAEAIAAYFGQQPHVEHFGDNIAEAIRNGTWKEYL